MSTGSLIVIDSQYRWEEITDAQSRKNGFVTYPWSGLTDLIKGKEQMLSADGQHTFALRQSGKFIDLRNSMGNIYNAVTTITASDNNTLDRLKYEFENACSARSSNMEETDSSFKASFECLIPEGGIVHNNVQRMLLSSGVDQHTNNVPMAILVNHIEDATDDLLSTDTPPQSPS